MSVTWFVPRSDLSADQIRAVDLPVKEHTLVLGAPGSGKTLVLLHRAQRIIEEEGLSSNRLRIFVFTNTLKDYIRSTLTFLDIPDNRVTTFDLWCREFHKAFISPRLPFLKSGPDFDAIRIAVLTKLREEKPLTLVTHENGKKQRKEELSDENEAGQLSTSPQSEFPEFFFKDAECPLYDAVLVDEGQDLDPDAFEILTRVSRHISACMDSHQQLYDRGCDEQDILDKLGLRKCNFTILGAYRCCPYVTALAATLLHSAAERQAFLNQRKATQIEKTTPLLYIATDVVDEKNRVATVIKDRLVMGDRIAVLFQTNAKLYSMANFLAEKGLEVEVPVKRTKKTYFTHDFQSDRPKLMTYYGAKGLTFETIIMPRLVPSSFTGIGHTRLEKLLFVGITRATKWVFLSMTEGPTLPFIKKLLKPELKETITLQRANTELPLFNNPQTTQNIQQTAPLDDLTDLF